MKNRLPIILSAFVLSLALSLSAPAPFCAGTPQITSTSDNPASDPVKKVNKYIADNSISLSSDWNFHIEGSDQLAWVALSRSGYIKELFGLKRIDTWHYFQVDVAGEQWPKVVNPQVRVAFSRKQQLFLISKNKGTETFHHFRMSSFWSTRAGFDLSNSDLLPIVNADQVFLVLPLNDGTTRKVEVPPDIHKEWKYIVTCNLVDEYKKDN